MALIYCLYFTASKVKVRARAIYSMQGWFWPEEKLATKCSECACGGQREEFGGCHRPLMGCMGKV